MISHSDFITPISGLQYYVCMLDYGSKLGLGADVAPEYTRRQIVETVRDAIMTGKNIVHVKHINGNDMLDVTHEIIRDALDENYNPGLISVQDLIDERSTPVTRIEAGIDRVADYRKHGERV